MKEYLIFDEATPQKHLIELRKEGEPLYGRWINVKKGFYFGVFKIESKDWAYRFLSRTGSPENERLII